MKTIPMDNKNCVTKEEAQRKKGDKQTEVFKDIFKNPFCLSESGLVHWLPNVKTGCRSYQLRFQ